MIDVDELLEAHRHGLVDSDTAESAVRRAVAAVRELAKHGDDLNAWAAAAGMELSWREA